MSSRVVRVDHDHAPRPRSDRLLQTVKINLPPVVVNQRIAHQLHILNVRQKSEQRVTRRGNQQFIPGITKQAKNEGVRFARAGSQHHILGGNRRATSGVILRHRDPRALQTFRIWLVAQRCQMPQSRKDRFTVVREATLRRVRSGQIKQPLPAGAMPRQRLTQSIPGKIPIRPLCKHPVKSSSGVTTPSHPRPSTALRPGSTPSPRPQSSRGRPPPPKSYCPDAPPPSPHHSSRWSLARAPFPRKSRNNRPASRNESGPRSTAPRNQSSPANPASSAS